MQTRHRWVRCAGILTAFSDIRLRLDEAGVTVEFGGEEFNPDRVHRLILNRSFFIAMKEPAGKQPWFLGWIANGELMELAEQ